MDEDGVLRCQDCKSTIPKTSDEEPSLMGGYMFRSDASEARFLYAVEEVANGLHAISRAVEKLSEDKE